MSFSVFLLVGGAWWYSLGAGFFDWDCPLESSVVEASRGARLLVRDLMCLVSVLVFGFVRALVGGAWNNSGQAGLWCWNLNETSSNAWTNNGARLLNLIMGLDVCEFVF